MKPIQALLLAVLLFICACQPQTASQPSQPVVITMTKTVAALTTTATKETQMTETPFPTPMDADLSAVVEQARQDLSKRLSIDPGKIELVETAAVTWRDGSLGCPKPGMMYTQALVEGYQVKLRADGKIYDYHSGGGRPPFLCEP